MEKIIQIAFSNQDLFVLTNEGRIMMLGAYNLRNQNPKKFLEVKADMPELPVYVEITPDYKEEEKKPKDADKDAKK